MRNDNLLLYFNNNTHFCFCHFQYTESTLPLGSTYRYWEYILIFKAKTEYLNKIQNVCIGIHVMINIQCNGKVIVLAS